MVLLHILAKTITNPSKTLLVGHFDHRLRGSASDHDRKLVERAAGSLGLTFRAGFPQTSPPQSGVSLEAWARRERLSFLGTCARSIHARHIVTGHTLDDQLELLFLRLFRGEASSLGGMADGDPFPYDPSLSVLRPWLSVPKAQLRSEARRLGIAFREDASNRNPAFRRNWARHQLLPRITREYGPGIGPTLQRVTKILADESAYLELEASRWLNQPADEPALPFVQLPVALQRRVLLRQFREASVIPTFEAIERLRARFGRGVSLEGGLQASLRPNGRVSFQNPSARPVPPPHASQLLRLNHSSQVEFAGVRFQWRIRASNASPRSTPGRERFDADAVGGRIELRFWRPGDRFQPSGFPKPAKLQDLFVSAKIPRAVRHRLVVATAENGEIFWVEGLRIAERFKLRPETVRYLDWRWHRPVAHLATHRCA
jgi:tRNA(Ile)-lysidine synthase